MRILKMFNILVFLTFKLFAQGNFPKDIIEKEKIKKASKYLVIPKTNPDYKKKPVGLMLKSETSFDNNGNVTSIYTPNGAVASHSGSKDILQSYSYEGDKIIKMSKKDFETISVEYLYYDKKNLVAKIKTNEKNERIGLELQYSSSVDGKEIKKIEIDFYNTSDSNRFVYIERTNVIYIKDVKKINSTRKLFDITKQQLDIVQYSDNFEDIEKTLIEIEEKTFLDSVNFTTSYFYGKKGELKKEISKDSSIEYMYDNDGLLNSYIIKSKHYSFTYKILYSKE